VEETAVRGAVIASQTNRILKQKRSNNLDFMGSPTCILPEVPNLREDGCWANLDPTIGSEINQTRPVAIISGDTMNKFLDTVVVCPLTTKLHLVWRGRIQTVCGGQQNEIAVDQICAISKRWLYKKLDTLDLQTASRLCQQS